MKIADWYDQSDLIIASEHTTRDAILIGMVLAAIVLLIFFRELESCADCHPDRARRLAATILLLSS